MKYLEFKDTKKLSEQEEDKQARIKLAEHRQLHTDRISTQVRTISFGTLATAWGLILTNPSVALQLQSSFKNQLILLCIFSILTLFLDYLQYVFGYLNIQKRLDTKDPIKFKKLFIFDFYHKANVFFFWLKQIFTAVCVVWLVVILGLLSLLVINLLFEWHMNPFFCYQSVNHIIDFINIRGAECAF